jgi:hypothetical protein
MSRVICGNVDVEERKKQGFRNSPSTVLCPRCILIAISRCVNLDVISEGYDLIDQAIPDSNKYLEKNIIRSILGNEKLRSV